MKQLYVALFDLAEHVDEDLPQADRSKHLRMALNEAQDLLGEHKFYESPWIKTVSVRRVYKLYYAADEARQRQGVLWNEYVAVTSIPDMVIYLEEMEREFPDRAHKVEIKK